VADDAVTPQEGAGRRGPTRRQVLVAGAVLLGGATGLGTVLAGRDGEDRPTGPLPVLPSLPLQPDAAGVQTGQLTAAGSGSRLAYDGSVPGPVLRLREGQRVRLGFRNHTDAHSSLHLHGLPIGPDVDRPLVHLLPGEQDLREFTLPVGSAGTAWYHPHAHGDVERQLLAGLAGAVVVAGPVDDLPGLVEADDQLVMLTRDGRELVVNGVQHPLLTASAARVRLRLLNATAADVLRLAVLGDGGAVELQQLASDAGLLTAPTPVRQVLLPPGGRAEVVVDAAAAGTGRLRLTALPYSVNADGSGTSRSRTLLSIDLPSGPALPPLPSRLGAVPVLDAATAARTRRIVLDADADGGFTVDGRPFDHRRTDLTARAGTLEVWEIVNAHTVDHPFHLHSHRVQVLDVDGRPPPHAAWLDTVNVRGGQTVRLAVPLTGGAGRTVYHCHVASHEDLGMMGVLDVRA
jgi:FtsP/CotA-like multicopper oxidase with cupredoxin domain